MKPDATNQSPLSYAPHATTPAKAREQKISARDYQLAMANILMDAEDDRKKLEDQGMAILSILKDVTEAHEKLKEVDKMKSEFVSIASHQLRTPITGVKWVLEHILKKKMGVPKETTGYLEDMYRSIQQLSELVDILLTAARLEEKQVQVVITQADIIDLATDAIKRYVTLCEQRNLKIRLTDRPEALTANTDPKLLGTIIDTLLANATDYTPPGGVIEMSLAARDKNFTIHVRDTGIGIPEEDKGRIFEKFKRGKNAIHFKTGGTGLGLHTAKQLTELLGGSIAFNSKEGKGSTFVVEMPLKKA